MERERLYYSSQDRELSLSAAFPALMRKVYIWMTLALSITGITAYGVASSPNLIMAIATNSGLMWGIIIGTFALVMIISSAINRLSLTTATLLFTLYSVLNGMMLSSIFLVYTMSSIAQVFFITAGTFAVMAAVGYFTKTDLTSFGKLLFMALIGLVIATIVNIFMKSGTMGLIISYVGVLIFVGLTAYDSQKIKQMLMSCDDVTENSQKLALLGSLTLYLDFLNLFLYLLRISEEENKNTSFKDNKTASSILEEECINHDTSSFFVCCSNTNRIRLHPQFVLLSVRLIPACTGNVTVYTEKKRNTR